MPLREQITLTAKMKQHPGILPMTWVVPFSHQSPSGWEKQSEASWVHRETVSFRGGGLLCFCSPHTEENCLLLWIFSLPIFFPNQHQCQACITPLCYGPSRAFHAEINCFGCLSGAKEVKRTLLSFIQAAQSCWIRDGQ